MSEHFKRILVPLDGSRLAESVLPLTVALAEKLGARITLIHIIEERAPQTVHGEPHLRTTAEAEAYLLEIARRFAGAVTFEHHVHGTEEHNVAQSIAAHVSELRADIVALCTHGRSGVRRVMSGSIAQQVLKRVSVPVLLVRPQMQDQTTIRAILVPLDGTPAAETALSAASELARAADAQLYLVSIVPTVDTVTGDRQAAARLTPIATSEALDVEEEQSKLYLEETAQRLRQQGLKASALVRRGNTVPSLAEAVYESSADLVVIATHARAGLNALVTGSVTATLAGKVAKPLLMIKIQV